jgi:hypothetical protein
MSEQTADTLNSMSPLTALVVEAASTYTDDPMSVENTSAASLPHEFHEENVQPSHHSRPVKNKGGGGAHKSKAAQWGIDEFERLLRLRSEGVSRVQIAKMLGRSHKSIQRKFERHRDKLKMQQQNGEIPLEKSTFPKKKRSKVTEKDPVKAELKRLLLEETKMIESQKLLVAQIHSVNANRNAIVKELIGIDWKMANLRKRRDELKSGTRPPPAPETYIDDDGIPSGVDGEEGDLIFAPSDSPTPPWPSSKKRKRLADPEEDDDYEEKNLRVEPQPAVDETSLVDYLTAITSADPMVARQTGRRQAARKESYALLFNVGDDDDV